MDINTDSMITAAIILGILFLLGAGVRALRHPEMDRKKAWLMIAVAILTFLNLYMWLTMPDTPPATIEEIALPDPTDG